jgi:hypothetical protein
MNARSNARVKDDRSQESHATPDGNAQKHASMKLAADGDQAREQAGCCGLWDQGPPTAVIVDLWKPPICFLGY